MSNESYREEPDIRQLILIKNRERYIFRYNPGDESRVAQEMIDTARNPDNNFDAFDAMVLMNHIGYDITSKKDEKLGSRIR